MGALRDFASFKRLLMPYILQVLFWCGIGGTLYGAYWLFTHDNWAWWMALLFGTLVTRLIFESLILRYRSYELLVAIRKQLRPENPDRPAE